MTIKKRRTKEEVIRDTFLNAQHGTDLLPLLRYAKHKTFTFKGATIRTNDENCQCPLEAVMSLDGAGVWVMVREVLSITEYNRDLPSGTIRAVTEFIDAADNPLTTQQELRKSILDAVSGGVVPSGVVVEG